MIYLTFASNAPAEQLIFFTFVALLLASLFSFEDDWPIGLEKQKSHIALALDYREKQLRKHVLLVGVGHCTYHFFFWYGFTNLTDNTGYVLSFLALNIFITPLVVSKHESSSNKNTHPPLGILVAGIALIFVASFVASIDAPIPELASKFREMSFFTPYTVFIFIALLGEVVVMREITIINKRVATDSTFTVLSDIEDEDYRKRIINIVVTTQYLPYAIFVFFILFGYRLIQENLFGFTWGEISILSAIIVFFVMIGVVVRNFGTIQLRSKGIPTDFIDVSIAMRPIIFFFLAPYVGILIHYFLCSTEDGVCETSTNLLVTNKFLLAYSNEIISLPILAFAGYLFYRHLHKIGLLPSFKKVN